MNLFTLRALFIFIFLQSTTLFAQFPEWRLPTEWPFAQNSIWNMPIGSDAIYVPAQIGEPQGWAVTSDEDLIIFTPNALQKPVLKHDAGWSDNLRCESIVEPNEVIITNAPVPNNFSTDPGYSGLRPNHSAAILMADGETITQTQPLHVCGNGGPVVSQFRPPDDNIITGDGIRGAHGGSGMSSVGGTIRLGELVPGGVIRHALKLNLFAQKYIAYNDDETRGYRWPAIRADGYADESTYGGTVPALEMGALLALLPEFDLNSLSTEPAKILATAFINYGGYLVDDTAWDVFALTTEWGPNGRVLDEFESIWGYAFEQQNSNTPWAQDLEAIFSSLHVVDNNGPSNIGGGGTPRQALAPPFCLDPPCDLNTSVYENRNSEQIEIIPNPNNGRFQIKWGAQITLNSSFTYQIHNHLGQLVVMGQIGKNTQDIWIPGPKGIYLLTLDYKGSLITKKLIKD